MTPASDVRVVLCTAPAADADRIARQLVEERLCACVNVLPGVRSVYRWQDAVETADEQLLIVKTTAAVAPRLRERLVAMHPYDVPEVIELPVADGYRRYFDWVDESVG